jgi:hypothetical protein
MMKMSKQTLTFEEYREEYIKQLIERKLLTEKEATQLFSKDEMIDAYDYGTSLEDAISAFEYFGE